MLKKSLAAALLATLALGAARPAAALDWSGVDPLAQFAQSLKALPAPQTVAGKVVPPFDPTDPKPESDAERWGRIMNAAQAGEAVTKADKEWAQANFEKMWRKARFSLRKQIRAQVKSESARLLLAVGEGLSWKQRRAVVTYVASAAKQKVRAELDNAKVK